MASSRPGVSSCSRARAAPAPAKSSPRSWPSASRAPNSQRLDLERGRFARAPLVVGVVSRAAPHVKIPQWEQQLSAGAVCMALTVAATAMGFRTAWVTEWCAYDREAMARFGLADHERIAGFIHIGRVDHAPEDRARPDLDTLVTTF